MYARWWLLTLLLTLTGHAEGQRKMLCLQDKVSVHYNAFKTSESDSTEKWQVDVEITNESAYDLYYRSYRAFNGKGPVLAPYLEVKVLNELNGLYKNPLYIHGGITLQMTTDSSMILRLDRSRQLHSFDATMRKGSVPIVQGSFLEKLMPLSEAKKKRKPQN